MTILFQSVIDNLLNYHDVNHVTLDDYTVLLKTFFSREVSRFGASDAVRMPIIFHFPMMKCE